MNKLMKKKKKGFTLIELIAVIAILAVLAVVAVPRVITYVDKSKKSAVQTEATTVYNAAEAAYNDGALKDKITDDKKFDNLTIGDIYSVLVKDSGDKDLISGDTELKKLGGTSSSLTLEKLKEIMNSDVNNINVTSDGVVNTTTPVNPTK